MESEADSLRQDLKRYRFLVLHNTDRQVAAVLHELIAEAEARLRALEPAPPRRTPQRRRVV
jgi:hypothetical protein